MKLRFTKMQGAGNDFVMLDGVGQSLVLTPERVRRLADRRLGVGADQVLLVEAATEAGADFRYRIFNADGQEVEQCGNGARCFVKFVRELGLTGARTIRVQTLGGRIEPHLEDDGEVSVDMGPPDLRPEASGLRSEGLARRMPGGPDGPTLWALPLEATTVEVCMVSMGNPHAVQFVDDVDRAPVTSQGPRLERHERFAQGVNAGFAQVLDRSTLRLRVWERGAGETLACGSGACAAAVAAIALGRVDSPVRVLARGGALRVAWDRPRGRPGEPLGTAASAHVWMTGPAEKVFEGQIELP